MSDNARALVIVVVMLCAVGLAVGVFGSDGIPKSGATWTGVAAAGPRAPAYLAEQELVPPGNASAGASAIFGGAFVLAPMLAMVALALASAARHRARARAEQMLAPGAALANGSAVVFGKVESDGDAAPIVVRIHQKGAEVCQKGNWTHTWKERRRTVKAQAFTLARTDGSRVRVEPDERVVLHERLVVFERMDVDQRARVARLEAGAEVHVTGELTGVIGASHGAYRGTGALPILRPPGSAPMIVADEPVGATERERARFYLAAAASLTTALAATAYLMAPYPTLLATGEVVQGHPTETGRWQTWTKPKNRSGYWVQHYGVRATGTLASGRQVALEGECAQAVHDCAAKGNCATIPFEVSSTWPDREQIGAHATASSWSLGLALVVTVLVSVTFPIVARSTRPWYLKRRVDDSGSGRLASSV